MDTNVVYTENRLKGADVTTAETFTPSKSGYTFIGWRTDTQANSSVQSSMIVGTNDITLYAVFRKTITCTFKSYDSTKTVTGYLYYNNGNTTNASVTVPTNASYSGWTWRGWSAAGTTTGNAAVTYANGDIISGLSSNKTYYGLYQTTITLSYNGNGSTGGSTSSHTGTRYYNAYGNYTNPSFTIKSNGFSKTYYTFNKWAQGSASGTKYAAGASVTLSANTTFYATWTATTTYLYKAGDECSAATGGWTSGYTMSDNGYTTKYTITKNSGNLYMYTQTDGQANAAMGTANKINLAPFSKIVLDIKCGSNWAVQGGGCMFVITNSKSGFSNLKKAIADRNDAGGASRKTVEIDVSGYSGNFYIAFYNARSTGEYIYLYNMYLVP